jgi:hypothetical protein
MVLMGESVSTRKETCASATLSTTSPTWTASIQEWNRHEISMVPVSTCHPLKHLTDFH